MGSVKSDRGSLIGFIEVGFDMRGNPVANLVLRRCAYLLNRSVSGFLGVATRLRRNGSPKIGSPAISARERSYATALGWNFSEAQRLFNNAQSFLSCVFGSSDGAASFASCSEDAKRSITCA
jgi:hypothetical protein